MKKYLSIIEMKPEDISVHVEQWCPLGHVHFILDIKHHAVPQKYYLTMIYLAPTYTSMR